MQNRFASLADTSISSSLGGYVPMRLLTLLLAAGIANTANAQLHVDFNSTTQDGGPHNAGGHVAYDAGHEVAADFVTQSYTAFGGASISVTPAWPNTTDNRVQQMIDRGAAFDATWVDTHDPANGNVGIDVVTDFLGIDTRTGNGGNGNWDGTNGTPTHMTLTLGGIPAGKYDWLSLHHDTEHVHTEFAVSLSTDGGTSFTPLADGYMSDGSDGGNPSSLDDGGQTALVTTFAEAITAGSVYTTSFDANGTDDVVFQFTPYSGRLGDAVHNQIWGINGFILTQVPEPTSGVMLSCLGVAMLGLRRRKQ